MKRFPKGRIVFLTDLDHPAIRADDEIWAEVLRTEGFEVVGEPWETLTGDEEIDAVVVRSTWNYHHHHSKFLEFLDRMERVGVTFFNDPFVLRQNIDKRYLRSLQQSGLPVIPTEWVSVDRIESMIQKYKNDTNEWVVKPSISASSHNTFRISFSEFSNALACIREAVDVSGVALLQPFLPEIATQGEWSMLFTGAEHIYTVRKLPKTGDFRVQAEHGGIHTRAEATPEMVQIAQRAIQWVKDSSGDYPLYARVDGVVGVRGFEIMELELTEPSLYLTYAPESAVLLTRELLLRL